MATATSTLSPEEQAATALLNRPEPDNNPAPADPTAGKNGSAQNKLTPEQEEKERLLKRSLDLRKDLEGLLGKLPHEAARKTIQEQLKDAVPKAYHKREQLLAMQADLNLACDMVGRLNKVLQAPKAPPAGPVQPPTPTLPASPPPTQPAPTPSLGARLWRWWKPALIVTAVLVPTIIAILLISGVRFGGQGSGGGTPSKPANIKFDF